MINHNKGPTGALPRRRRNQQPGFTPFTPPPLPPDGDPSYQSAIGTARRGLGYQQADVNTGTLRLNNDFGIGSARITGQRDQQLGALQTALRNANADYTTNTTGLGRQYGQLANRQNQASTAANASLGAIMASQQHRQTNQGLQQSALDTAMQRYQQQNQTDTTNVNNEADFQRGQLDLTRTRGIEDLTTPLTRAQTEEPIYEGDVRRQAWWAANQDPYATAPPNEMTQHGVTFQALGHNTFMLPNGRIIRGRRPTQRDVNAGRVL